MPGSIERFIKNMAFMSEISGLSGSSGFMIKTKLRSLVELWINLGPDSTSRTGG